MAVSDELMRLSVRAKQAEDRAAAAKTQARDKLEQDVQTARESTQATADKLRGEAGGRRDQLTSRNPAEGPTASAGWRRAAGPGEAATA
jgi:hypothetical protein